jgi:hypothetical protein
MKPELHFEIIPTGHGAYCVTVSLHDAEFGLNVLLLPSAASAIFHEYEIEQIRNLPQVLRITVNEQESPRG